MKPMEICLSFWNIFPAAHTNRKIRKTNQVWAARRNPFQRQAVSISFMFLLIGLAWKGSFLEAAKKTPPQAGSALPCCPFWLTSGQVKRPFY